MESKEKEVLKSVLAGFFRDNFYKDAVIKLRKSIKEKEYYREHWESVIRLIVGKGLEEGEPLYLMDNSANLPIDENSDTEAYKWLNLMLINSLGAEDAMIIEY